MKNAKKAYEKHDIMFWLGLPYTILGGVFTAVGLVAGILSGEWIFAVCFFRDWLDFSGVGNCFSVQRKKKEAGCKKIV